MNGMALRPFRQDMGDQLLSKLSAAASIAILAAASSRKRRALLSNAVRSTYDVGMAWIHTLPPDIAGPLGVTFGVFISSSLAAIPTCMLWSIYRTWRRLRHFSVEVRRPPSPPAFPQTRLYHYERSIVRATARCRCMSRATSIAGWICTYPGKWASLRGRRT